MSKKGGAWSAQITDAGERLLAGEPYESVRPAKKTNARQATNKELSREPGSGRSQQDADARRRRSIASAFLKRIDEAAGVLHIEEPTAEDRAEARQGISAAEATDAVPTGKVLRAVGVRTGPLTVKLVDYAPVDAYISPRQYDVLEWIAEGCPDGRHEDVAHRQTARLLHGRGLVQVTGRADMWAAQITDRGQQVLVHQKDRVNAERAIQQRQARQAEAQRQRDAQDLEQAKALVAELVEAEGRVDVGHRYRNPGLHRVVGLITSEGLVAKARRVEFEPTMMDERLGYTVYLAPDFTVQIEARAVPVPTQLRLASSAVIAFRDRRDRVSKSEIPRAARILQAIVDAVQERSWSAATFDPGYRIQGSGGREFDLTVSLGRLKRHVVIRERNGKARGGPAFVEKPINPYDWRSHETKIVRNRDFDPTGELILQMNDGQDHHRYRGSDSVWRDSKSHTLESQLPEVLHLLDVAAAQADWERSELQRRQVLIEQRWTQIHAQAVRDYSYDERVQHLEDELARWDSAQQMRAYSDAILFTSSSGRSNSRTEARAWAEWIRIHADNIDPLKGPLRPPPAPEVSDTELEPYLHGWSSYGPSDRFGSRSRWS